MLDNIHLVLLCSISLASAIPFDASPTNATAAQGSSANATAAAPGMTTDLSLPTDKKSGQMTFYTFWNSAAVSCNPSKCPEDGYCAAIPLKYMQPSGSSKASCGKCIKIVCKDKAAIVRVMDTCPECPDVNIDISDKLFKELVGDLGMGRTNVDWGFVECNSGGPASQSTPAQNQTSSSTVQQLTSTSQATTQPSTSSIQGWPTTIVIEKSSGERSSVAGGLRFKAHNASIVIALD